ncbi:hypothetical protein ACHAPX_002117 [Trichoderma viride]
MARALCSLDSVSRWAVTGTPIQNRLNDLTALLKFLRVYPYSDEDKFNADISRLWKIGEVDEAEKRLKRLAGCIVLRRPKTTIQLPPRHDFKQFVELSPAERELYKAAKMHAISHFNQALATDGKLNGTHSYAHMLQRIEAMRMICNLGVYYKMRHDLETYNEETSQEWNEETAQRMFNLYPQKDRQNVIKRFRDAPTMRVLLLTISCGAVGLTLTEASRAYLMEPHWNPTLEDQALARIHRIGQTKEVTTVRFIVRDSFEERVVELQQFKTDLASVINLQNENNGTRRPLEVSVPTFWPS